MKRLAREQGIEPQFTVLETVVLPLHHSRNGAAKENRTLVLVQRHLITLNTT